MLWSAQSLSRYTILAQDGEIGKTKEFLFDDEIWLLSYLVVDTGEWLSGRKVLISPIAIGQPDRVSRLFPVNLTKEQVEKSPPIESNKPISRQHQIQLHDYYAWPYYWAVGAQITPVGVPFSPPPPLDTETPSVQSSEGEELNPHLRSVKEVTGYHIETTDGEIGHVEDFIVDDEFWLIRYLVIDTRNWLPGRKVLISPTWVKEIDWSRRKVYLDQSKEAVEQSPEYDPSASVNRRYEVQLYDYYGRPKYWE